MKRTDGWTVVSPCLFDDGTPLGSSHNEECKIDSIVQAGRYYLKQ